jgi:hypothetical protein
VGEHPPLQRLQQLRERWETAPTDPEKPEVVAALADRTDRDARASEPIDWWKEITDEDRQYLLGPTLDDPPTPEQLAARRAWRAGRHPGKCFFCGGRTVHNPQCFTLTFTSVLPFGRYKGRPVSEVPKGYLAWLLKNSTRLGSDLRVEIQRVMRNAGPPVRALHSAKKPRLMNSEPPEWRPAVSFPVLLMSAFARPLIPRGLTAGGYLPTAALSARLAAVLP